MEDCSCSIDPAGYDGPEFITTRVVRARKAHVCIECDETIQPGEPYEVVRGVWEGEWSRFKTCLVCVRIREDFFPRGFLYGGLSTQLWECLEIPLR